MLLKRGLRPEKEKANNLLEGYMMALKNKDKDAITAIIMVVLGLFVLSFIGGKFNYIRFFIVLGGLVNAFKAAKKYKG